MSHRSPMHRRTRRLLGAVAATSLAVAGAVALANTGQAAENQDQPAVKDTSIRGAKSATAIPGSYLVVLNEQARTAVRGNVRTLASSYGVTARTTFDTALQGFSAKMTEAQARKVAQDDRVAYVQQNQQIRMTQDNPTWGLDRVDQRDLPLDQKYTPPGEAENVNVYVIDTGIYAEHTDFGGRAAVGTDTVGDGQNGKDCQGHGSHVAGTIAGEKWGLAKKAKVFGVRVLDCSGSGSTETVVAGIEWVTENAAKPAVANMSLGGGADDALDAAVKASVESGITYAVAAGNESEDSCTGSPSREPSALTVGATDDSDTKANFSDFGKCLDIFAPGVEVESVSIDGPDASVKHSGTSMASPHVAGAAALFLGQKPDATPEEVGTALTTNATPDKVQQPGEGSPNLLLYVAELNSPGPNG
jgi:subtilisin family serine protease